MRFQVRIGLAVCAAGMLLAVLARASYLDRAFATMHANKSAEVKPDLEKYLELAPHGAQATQAKQMLAAIE